MASQTLDQQEFLCEDVLGHQPVRDIVKTSPFHHLVLFLFWKLFKMFGKDHIKKKRYADNGVMFTLDSAKTGGIGGCFICTAGTGKLSYNLYYFTSDDPDFSENSQSDYFPKFSISMGYRSSSGVGWNGHASEEEQLKPGKYETSINISGPEFESSIHFKDFTIELFLVRILKDYYLPHKDWLEFKTKEVRGLK